MAIVNVNGQTGGGKNVKTGTVTVGDNTNILTISGVEFEPSSIFVVTLGAALTTGYFENCLINADMTHYRALGYTSKTDIISAYNPSTQVLTLTINVSYAYKAAIQHYYQLME